ncbi:hypothetical protein AAF712_013995 [Marasmius tenuissimus]|uniref:Uncharacterized protein n=1 Tax=Marasmius tenuissimus TaxID=585030 RepID=A0ABR2ZC98_9AGAR
MVGLIQANLASIALESSLYGFYLLLSIISLVGSIKYAEPIVPPSHYRRTTIWSFISSRLQVLKRPIFVGGLLIVASVTGHWITDIVRLFGAFVYAPHPEAYYADTSHITQLMKNIFLSASAVIGDALIIYRMWVVWGRPYRIIIFPIISLAGTTAAGIVVTYLFRSSTPGVPVFDGSIGKWITVHSILSTVTNLYCSVLISWKIWHQMRQTSSYVVTERPLTRILILFIESAALYAIWQLVFLTLLFARSNIQFTFVDSYPPVTGIAFMSINARIYLSSWSPNTDKRSNLVTAAFATSTGARGQEREESFVLHSVRPVEVQITVEHDNVPPGKDNNDPEWTQPLKGGTVI